MGDDVRVIAAAITALAAIGVFFAGRFVTVVADAVGQRRRHAALVSALFTEIKHNVEELELSRRRLPSRVVLQARFEAKPDANILIVYSRNMVFFEELRSELTALETAVLEHVVRFYSLLQKIY